MKNADPRAGVFLPVIRHALEHMHRRQGAHMKTPAQGPAFSISHYSAVAVARQQCRLLATRTTARQLIKLLGSRQAITA